MNLLKQIRDRGLILDGAMSTALEKLGIDTNNELWTAIALEHNLAQIYQVHMNYFKAGARWQLLILIKQISQLLKNMVLHKTRLLN